MTEQETGVALVIVAHPDDAEFGCAGTVAAWVREGWTVYYVITTDASGGGADDAIDVGADARRAISERRKAEQRAAAAILGVRDVVFLDRPDGRLEPTLDFRRDIVRLIRQYRPQRVVCQSPDRIWSPQYVIGRQHPDHLATGQATMAAFYPAAQNAWDFPELLAEGLLPHKVRELYVMGAPLINHPVDISATIDLKIEALRAHESQLGARFDELEPRIREWTAQRGTEYGFAHAEAFHRTEH
jgi:LmbE family N-acetylglucosaminyl deacetylase